MEASHKHKYLKYKTKFSNLLKSLNKTGGSPQKEIMLFKADWCGHCNRFKPTFDKVSEMLNSKYKFTVIDIEKNPELTKQNNIEGFPTVLIKDNEGTTEYSGGRDFDSFYNYLNEL